MDCIEENFPYAAEFDLDTPCWNERTNAFYKRLGYRIIKAEDGYLENDINMETKEMKINGRKCILPAVFCKSPAGVWTQADLCVH